VVKFVSGAVFGAVLAMAASAYAATCVGAGDLLNWTVSVDGEEVCTDPSVDIVSKEIECP
jgi:hypothetical protein